MLDVAAIAYFLFLYFCVFALCLCLSSFIKDFYCSPPTSSRSKRREREPMMIIRNFDYKRSSLLQMILQCTLPKLRGAPQFWKTSPSGADAWNSGSFWGVKNPQKSAKKFVRSRHTYKKYFLKKIRSKPPSQPSAVVRAIYIRLYGVATAN